MLGTFWSSCTSFCSWNWNAPGGWNHILLLHRLYDQSNFVHEKAHWLHEVLCHRVASGRILQLRDDVAGVGCPLDENVVDGDNATELGVDVGTLFDDDEVAGAYVASDGSYCGIDAGTAHGLVLHPTIEAVGGDAVAGQLGGGLRQNDAVSRLEGELPLVVEYEVLHCVGRNVAKRRCAGEAQRIQPLAEGGTGRFERVRRYLGDHGGSLLSVRGYSTQG